LSSSSRSRVLRSRALRVSAERVFELARHLTERDRAIAFALYEHQLLTTDQLTLLFFSSRRRAQDRLRFLYDERVLDRFYPPRPYGLGKPQAHWLLDEAGAILVAASLGLERKRLGWQRRDDWGSHPQLLHRLEANRLVTELIAATVADGSLGVSEWWGSRSAAARLADPSQQGRPIPDGGFFLEAAAGPVECYLEWDRGTETLARLTHKLKLYWHAEVHSSERDHINVLFVVPTERRLQALVDAVAADTERRLQARDNWFTPSWPLLASLIPELTAQGPLARVWRPLADPAQRLRLSELRARTGLAPIEFARCLGRRWRKEQPDFWETLSPLGIPATRSAAAATPQPEEPTAPVIEGPSPVVQMRERLLTEARRDAQQSTASARFKGDWTSSGIDGLMLDPDEEPDQEWR
jgi:Replication-relaxation